MRSGRGGGGKVEGRGGVRRGGGRVVVEATGSSACRLVAHWIRIKIRIRMSLLQ